MLDLEKGIVNHGNWKPIQQCMRKALRGEDITVAFLGGSVTQGSLSSTPQTCYAYLVYEWWQKKFPEATVHYVNAGIGGTNSQFAVARVKEDVLAYRPDFLLTEFSVNDDNNEHFQETYEGMVRTILGEENGPALLLMFNFYYLKQCSAQKIHLEVGKHYDLPCVSMKSTINEELLAGILKQEEISPDGLHPNDVGHNLIAQVVIHLLEKIYQDMTDTMGEWEAKLPSPLTRNRYEHSIRYQNDNCEPICEGFAADGTLQKHITECFRKGYIAYREGSKITFEVAAACIAVQYRKSVKKPAPIAKIVVDGEVSSTRILDGNFEEDWGDCLYLETLYESDESKKHTVEIEIIQGTKAEEVPFYLVSVIGSGEEKA